MSRPLCFVSQGLGNFGEQGDPVNRLLQSGVDRMLGRMYAVWQGHVPRAQDDWQVGSKPQNLFDELVAGHPWHGLVGEQKIPRLRTRGEGPPGLDAIGKGLDQVTSLR